jgi:hypothetical protein
MDGEIGNDARKRQAAAQLSGRDENQGYASRCLLKKKNDSP